jgi:hypothetical protein
MVLEELEAERNLLSVERGFFRGIFLEESVGEILVYVMGLKSILSSKIFLSLI